VLFHRTTALKRVLFWGNALWQWRFEEVVVEKYFLGIPTIVRDACGFQIRRPRYGTLFEPGGKFGVLFDEVL